MKIIIHGRPPEERIWLGSCTRCATVAEAEQRELKVSSCQREGEWAEATCPVCAGRILFYPKAKK